jgi:hypothetical protein
VFGPVDLLLAAGAATLVYAIGSIEKGSFRLVTQVITGLGAPPSHVGTGGGSAANATLPLTVAVLAALLVLAGSAALVRVPVRIERRNLR